MCGNSLVVSWAGCGGQQPAVPIESLSVQGCAGSGPAAESGSYLGYGLGLSGCHCGAGLTGPKLLPGCVMTCIQAWRLHRCRAQREIIEFMDICKTAGVTSSGLGGSPVPHSSLCGVQHL